MTDPINHEAEAAIAPNGGSVMSKRNDVAVSCETCGAELGYVIDTGHKRWLCPQCSSNGKVESVGVGASAPKDDPDAALVALNGGQV